jgi:hypothetical protein
MRKDGQADGVDGWKSSELSGDRYFIRTFLANVHVDISFTPRISSPELSIITTCARLDQEIPRRRLRYLPIDAWTHLFQKI